MIKTIALISDIPRTQNWQKITCNPQNKCTTNVYYVYVYACCAWCLDVLNAQCSMPGARWVWWCCATKMRVRVKVHIQLRSPHYMRHTTYIAHRAYRYYTLYFPDLCCLNTPMIHDGILQFYCSILLACVRTTELTSGTATS
jgi:hypothetical protein